MAKNLENLKVAILVADGFEESELVQPRKALNEAGAQTILISPQKNKVKAWKHGQWSDEYPVDLSIEKANPEDYDTLLLPGGVMNPDKLRMVPQAIDFIIRIAKAGKPIAAICHGPWTLIDANAVQGKTVTSWPSIRTDLMNAGAQWVDREVVVDDNLVTSRKPDDIPAFNEAMIELFSTAL
ncbi:MAG: type 1 glutamine amidotransferase domain-containing protein [Candidatus Babeliales bacterium]